VTYKVFLDGGQVLYSHKVSVICSILNGHFRCFRGQVMPASNSPTRSTFSPSTKDICSFPGPHGLPFSFDVTLLSPRCRLASGREDQPSRSCSPASRPLLGSTTCRSSVPRSLTGRGGPREGPRGGPRGGGDLLRRGRPMANGLEAPPTVCFA
jgi:hypothetical protein